MKEKMRKKRWLWLRARGFRSHHCGCRLFLFHCLFCSKTFSHFFRFLTLNLYSVYWIRLLSNWFTSHRPFLGGRGGDNRKFVHSLLRFCRVVYRKVQTKQNTSSLRFGLLNEKWNDVSSLDSEELVERAHHQGNRMCLSEELVFIHAPYISTNYFSIFFCGGNYLNECFVFSPSGFISLTICWSSWK